MPRLFVAIDVPEDQRLALQALYDESLPARWTPLEQLHLTLRFIGDVPDATAALLEQTLATIQADAFSLRLRGFDVFPSRRKPRVLFAALQAPPALFALQQDIEDAVVSLNLAPEDKPFHPHVTVARLKNARPQAVRGFLRTHQDFALPPFTAEAFHLYESQLAPSGSVYTRLASVRLR